MIAFLAWMLWSAGATGQSPTSQPSAERVVLAAPYIDGTFGFSIRPPADWMMLRERKANAVGVTVLRLHLQIAQGILAEISVRICQTNKAVTVESTLDELAAGIKKDMPNPVIAEKAVRTLGGKPSGYLAASFVLGGQPTTLLETIIQARRSEYYLIQFSGPTSVAPQLEPIYHAVVGSFRMLEDDSTNELIRDALLAANDWMNGLSTARLESIKRVETWMGVHRAGKLIGYMQIVSDVTDMPTIVSAGDPARSRKISGVGVFEQGWTFEPDGSAQRVVNEMFLTPDRALERWKQTTLIWSPASGKTSADVNVAVEEGALESGKLFTSQRFGAAAASIPNDPEKAPKTYVPRALVRLLPQLIGDLGKRRLLAFHEYDHEAKGLALRTVEFRDPVKVKVGPAAGKTYFVLREREGLSGPPTDIYVNESGRIVKIVTGLTMLKVMRREDLEREFLPRVEAAEKGVGEVEREYNQYRDRFTTKAEVGLRADRSRPLPADLLTALRSGNGLSPTTRPAAGR